MEDMRGRIAVVTGAASGIGRAAALALRARGADVIGWNRAPCESPDGYPIHAVDVADDAAVMAAAEHVLTAGPVDMLVNAAGVGGAGSATSVILAEWDRVFAVNLRGTLLVARAFLPAMIARGAGAIVNIGSSFGLVAREDCTAYAVSKAAVIHLTKCMAIDLADSGVRVNCVCPGLVETDMTAPLFAPGAETAARGNTDLHAMRRAGVPDEIGRAIAFLLSDEASFITGTALPVDGGYTAGKWIAASA
jgi:NAD(P)-dependent dehydrogenase (short-subunit alcohol dehydrogenase family)